MSISVEQFADRLSRLSATPFTVDDVFRLAEAGDVRLTPAAGIDAGQAQRLLDQVEPPSPVTGAQIVAADWSTPQQQVRAAPPMVFSSPGAVDDPEEQLNPSRRSSGARPARGQAGSARRRDGRNR